MKVDQDVPVAFTPATVPFVYRRFSHSQIDAVSKQFYVAAMDTLNSAGIPFLVGGAYAFAHYAGIDRHTKDFDIFVKKEDATRILETLGKVLKCKVDRTFPHWLYKTILGENFIDIIFSSGNGIARVDDVWFQKAHSGMVLGRPALLIPAEEMIWSKGFIMERERFDGADVVHVFRGWGTKMDWERLVARFDTDWRVLFSHLVLFGYIYPSELHKIPSWVMERMAQRLIAEQTDSVSPTSTPLPPTSTPLPPTSTPTNHTRPPLICQGTLLSRQQYLKDVEEWKYNDIRTLPRNGNPPIMSDDEISHWTAAAFNHGSGNP